MTSRSHTLYRLSLFALLFSAAAHAQTVQVPANEYAGVDCARLPSATQRELCKQADFQTKTIYLSNVATQQDANEILVTIRNLMEPSDKFYLISTQNALTIGTYPQEIARIEALVHELDRPRKAYRITYTVAVIEDGKSIGTQHYSMVAVDGQRVTMKEGDKIPVATGTFSTESASAQTQFTYLDVGMNFDATVSSLAGGVSLLSKIEQSSIGPTNTIAGVAEPVVRQSVLQSSASVTLGKPLMLGSIDVPNSTRHLDLDVLVELLK